MAASPGSPPPRAPRRKVPCVLADEGGARRAGRRPDDRDRRSTRLAAEARDAGVRVLEGHAAIGVYEGPSAALLGPEELVEVEAERVIVATGALEAHGVFPGNDLPGVWLGRGATRMAATQGVRVGERAVVVANTSEGDRIAEAIRAAGSQVTLVAGRVLEARGPKQVSSVTVLTPEGRRAFACDALVLSLGWAPRDTLLRMTADPEVVGAGDVVLPGCTIDDAERSGRAAGRGEPDEPREADPWPVAEPDGYVCVCEDVSMHDLEQAWDEGWTSSEILKRYTTATMGPCQGALCSRHLAEHARAKGAGVAARGRTTARPPVRAPRLGDLIGGVHEQVERRTALHDRHVEAGARIDHSGVWLRPGTYGDVADEIRAVRERVSLMDVSTLGKFLVAGRDARVLLDRVFPLDVGAVAPGRARYLLALDEAGYVMDDGLVAALPDGSYYVTSTSGGADRMEAWLRNWIDRLELHAHLVDLTAQLGAINVAGPHARELLATLSDDDLSRAAIPYPGHAEITVAGVPCRRSRSASSASSPTSCTTHATGASSCGMRCVPRALGGTSCPTAWTPSTCSGSRRGTSTSRRTRCPTITPRSSGSGGRSRWTSLRSSASARSSGWTRCRSNDGWSACASTAHRSAATRSRSTAPSSAG